MSKKDNREQAGGEETRMILGFNRDQRFRFYRWLAIAIVLFGGVWMFAFLQPQRWYKYTDVVSFEQVARDVKVGYVLWKNAKAVTAGVLPADIVSEPSISSDGTRMIYAREGKDKSQDLFLRRWNGTSWSGPRPMRALNSNFEETSPSLSGNGDFLYFTSARAARADMTSGSQDGMESNTRGPFP